jgi:hypothetical protein
MARKPRDYDAELQALMEKAKKVKTQKTTQLGELVQVVGADALRIGRCSPGRYRTVKEDTRGRGEVDRTRTGVLSARRQAGDQAKARRHCWRSYGRQRCS